MHAKTYNTSMHSKHTDCYKLIEKDTNTAKPCTENTILRTWQKVTWMLGMKTFMAPQSWLTVLVTFSPNFWLCDMPKCLQLVKTVISINAKEAKPNDDPKQKAICNITYILVGILQVRLVAQWHWQNSNIQKKSPN